MSRQESLVLKIRRHALLADGGANTSVVERTLHTGPGRFT